MWKMGGQEVGDLENERSGGWRCGKWEVLRCGMWKMGGRVVGDVETGQSLGQI